MFHIGHLNILRRAKEQCGMLIVGVTTDELCYKRKQKYPIINEQERMAIVEAIRYVDLVIPETNWQQKRSDMHEYHIDTFVMGDDWEGKFDFLKDYCDVVYLPRTPEISTTQIKKDLTEKKTPK